jgi:hypothetical protein
LVNGEQVDDVTPAFDTLSSYRYPQLVQRRVGLPVSTVLLVT